MLNHLREVKSWGKSQRCGINNRFDLSSPWRNNHVVASVEANRFFYPRLVFRARRGTASGTKYRPSLEALEDRWVPAIYPVTNTGDSAAVGSGSLRRAIIDLNLGNEAMNTIEFQGAGAQGTITLASALAPISRPVRILGPGWDVLTIARDPAQGDFRIFQVQTTGEVSIRQLTISGGRAGAGNGGGILLAGGTLNVTYCNITNNEADSGGGIAVDQGTLFVNFGSISGNTANTQGGGLYAGAGAGDVYLFGDDRTACNIINNQARSAGGGIYFDNPAVSNGSLTIDRANVWFNRVTEDGNGGGLFAQAPANRPGHLAPVLVTNTLFLGNFIAPTATGDGGAIYNNGIARFGNCTITGNTANRGGGLLHVLAAGNQTTLRSCTITRNTSRDGTGAALQVGGLDNNPAAPVGPQAGSPSAPGGGGGGGSGDGITLGNTIVAGNTAPTYPDVAGKLISLGHNLIGNGDGATGFLASDLVGTSSAPIDPLLGDLADNGGPTQTYLLLAGSPALAAGDTSLVDSATDQRGYDRIVDGFVDIGAVEMQPGELTGP